MKISYLVAFGDINFSNPMEKWKRDLYNRFEFYFISLYFIKLFFQRSSKIDIGKEKLKRKLSKESKQSWIGDNFSRYKCIIVHHV